MSGPSGPLPFGPFGSGGFDFAEIMRMLQSEGPINLDMARQVAEWVATEGRDQAGEQTGQPAGGLAGQPAGGQAGQPAGGQAELPDPTDVTLLGELTRTAQIHVQDATGLGANLPPEPAVLGRAAWAHQTLDSLEPVLVRLAERLTEDAQAGGDEPEPGGPAEAFDLGGILNAAAPLLLGMQSGFMIGHLASKVLGSYEMPLPLSSSPAVAYVAPNLAEFETDWSLPREELRFYVALHETLHASLRSVEWVQARILRLAHEYVSAFHVDPRAVEERLGTIDPSDPTAIQSAFGDPAEFLAAVRAPAQEHVLSSLRVTVALLEGYSDHVLDGIGRRLISEFDRIREASHRHRVERGEAARFLEALLGFEIHREEYEQAAEFCRGVVERAGEDGLRRLWTREEMFPTPAEIEAPGLWLERISLPDFGDPK